MIVGHFNVRSFSIFKAEYNPPIGSDCYAPNSFFISFELVQIKAMNIYILRGFCYI